MKWIGLVIAVFVAAVAAFMVLKLSGSDEKKAKPIVAQNRPVQVQQRAEPRIETVDVYVAANFIPVGTVVEENMLDVQPWPKHLLLKDFVVGNKKGEALVGMVTRSPFQPREPFIMSKMVNPDDPNFLAGNLPKGMRVATIRTNEIDGVAGFVFPGDRVDVLVTHEILKKGVRERDLKDARTQKNLYEDVTETLLSNVRVLAVDQRSSTGVNRDGGIVIPRSVSLEVAPEDSQRLKLATEIGKVSLTLRSLADKQTIETVAITRQSDLSQSSGVPMSDDEVPVANNDEEFIPVVVVRGTQVENEESLLRLEEARARTATRANSN
ncbi:MAG: Flp pilus assembly protein CpaB [Rickettsiales bacterium]|nr:Flp pilus assembly protein CpaB [Rickettsiales bacterium]